VPTFIQGVVEVGFYEGVFAVGIAARQTNNGLDPFLLEIGGRPSMINWSWTLA
jgi:hypothetical protein